MTWIIAALIILTVVDSIVIRKMVNLIELMNEELKKLKTENNILKIRQKMFESKKQIKLNADFKE